MLFNFLSMLESTVITGGGGGDAPAKAAQTATAAAQTGTDLGMGSGLMMVVVYAAVIGAMWFFMIRPQRKREKNMRDMQSSLKIGDNIMISSGLFGKIVSVGEDCFVIEFGTNKGVRIPVNKRDVVAQKSPQLGTGAVE